MPIPTEYKNNQAPSVPSKLFINTDLDTIAGRWNQYWPYQLMLVYAQKNEQGNVTHSETKYRYVLPVSPQELTVDMPMATTTIPTLNGIVEQHGGVPFRNITIQGTTGITPIKNSGNDKRDPIIGGMVDIANFAFGGTAQNATGTINTATRMIKGGSYEINKNNAELSDSDSDPNAIPAKSTGFYQYLLLEQFLASYHNLKQTNEKLENYEGKNLRLAFCIWKEQAVYLVSGVQLSRKRSASSPMEYTYTLQLKAWAKVKVDVGGIDNYNYPALAARNPNIVADIFNRIRSARETITNANSLLDSVLKESGQLVKEGLRQTTLCLKAGSGIQPAIDDFPEYIQKACGKAILDNWQTLKVTHAQLLKNFDKFGSKGKPVDVKLDDHLAASSAFKQLPPTSIPLPNTINDQINQELVTASNFSRLDYQTIKATLTSAAVELADKIGAGDANYHTYYEIPTNNMKTRTPTDQEWSVLFAIQESIQVLDYLAASSLINPTTVNSIDYIAGLSEQAGIAFQKPRSKFAIPFPYGATLERLALQYLGNANRWVEIATLNGLREPYVDEEGFKVNLLVNGDRNSLLITKDNRFYIGQSIWITARFLREKRRIINIVEIDGNFLLTVDGEANLERFRIIEGAYVEAFLPGTVNSQQTIFIPSQHTPADDPESRQIPGIDEFDPLLAVGGVDLLLTDTYDLAITNAGDCKLAYGLTNIIQTVKIAISTKQGANLQHPTFGFKITPGTSVADINVIKLIDAISETFKSDPMFVGVTVNSVKLNGNTLTLDLIIQVVGVSKYIPVTLQLKA